MSIKYTAAHALANAAAWLISLRRPLYLDQLSADECEAAGLPEGSTENAIHVHLNNCSPWLLQAWLDSGSQHAEGCLKVRAFGCFIEVYYLRKGDLPAIACAC
jgi:hypothetical protein